MNLAATTLPGRGLRVIALVASFLAAVGWTLPARTAVVPSRSEGVLAVDGIEMTVDDLDGSLAFYRDVLDFRADEPKESHGDPVERRTGVFGAGLRSVRMRLGTESIVLTEFLAPKGRPFPREAHSNDRSFQHLAIVVSDMERAYERLRVAKVRAISTSPQTLPDWNAAAGGIRAFYFRDPDGHPLEVIQFPAGKGASRWQEKERLFLGIDHTAITVADTDRSLAFYRDILGFEAKGESRNWGPEQERLNMVFGASLRITTLRAPSGPGVELLEYLAPGDGADMPRDEAANDLLHRHTTIVVDDLGRLLPGLRERGIGMIGGAETTTEGRAMRFRDPDGHVLEAIER